MNPEITRGPVPNMGVYSALQLREAEHRPIRVGRSARARRVAHCPALGTPVPGIRLAGIANRTLKHGERAFREAGIESGRRWAHRRRLRRKSPWRSCPHGRSRCPDAMQRHRH